MALEEVAVAVTVGGDGTVVQFAAADCVVALA
jgi:NAD kinase